MSYWRRLPLPGNGYKHGELPGLAFLVLTPAIEKVEQHQMGLGMRVGLLDIEIRGPDVEAGGAGTLNGHWCDR